MSGPLSPEQVAEAKRLARDHADDIWPMTILALVATVEELQAKVAGLAVDRDDLLWQCNEMASWAYELAGLNPDPEFVESHAIAVETMKRVASPVTGEEVSP